MASTVPHLSPIQRRAMAILHHDEELRTAFAHIASPAQHIILCDASGERSAALLHDRAVVTYEPLETSARTWTNASEVQQISESPDAVLVLREMAVCKAERRKGLGRALIGHVLREAKAAGRTWVVASTAKDNSAANALWEACGARCVGQFAYTLGDGSALVLNLWALQAKKKLCTTGCTIS